MSRRQQHRWGRLRSEQPVGKVRTAADLKPGDKAVVRTLNTVVSRQHLNKLMALGLLPGTKLVLLQRSPSLVLKVGETILAVDETIGRLVEVEPEN